MVMRFQGGVDSPGSRNEDEESEPAPAEGNQSVTVDEPDGFLYATEDYFRAAAYQALTVDALRRLCEERCIKCHDAVC